VKSPGKSRKAGDGEGEERGKRKGNPREKGDPGNKNAFVKAGLRRRGGGNTTLLYTLYFFFKIRAIYTSYNTSIYDNIFYIILPPILYTLYRIYKGKVFVNFIFYM